MAPKDRHEQPLVYALVEICGRTETERDLQRLTANKPIAGRKEKSCGKLHKHQATGFLFLRNRFPTYPLITYVNSLLQPQAAAGCVEKNFRLETGATQE